MRRGRRMKPAKNVGCTTGIVAVSEDIELLEDGEFPEDSFPGGRGPIALVPPDTKACERGRSKGLNKIVQALCHGLVPESVSTTPISGVQLEKNLRGISRRVVVGPDIAATDSIFSVAD